MLTYCLGCKKHNYNVCPKTLVMVTNKKIKGILKCANCLATKSFFDKIKHKRELEIIVSQF